MRVEVFILPSIVLLILSVAALKKVKVYEEFVDGAKDGFISVFKIAPYLLTMLFAIDIFRKSGAMDFLIKFISPVTKIFNIPDGVIPMIIIKPLSGSGALGIMTDIAKTYGVDSIEGRIAAVMMGSTETIFYTLSIYFGACQIKKIRHSLLSALIAHIIGCLAAVYVCYIFYK
ncbi:spore maturation protein [Fervidicella metallireducens AeB]|uniref:Spore maturation protein n=1 Tax=Fervidicella metallireducens AeB TaxID=1403537 RepID=A0A017RZC3_9CLOT|nr:nucleoside recognition domain-containing protein [Fervidicella metallireducens]EYE89754.1 spore maturation protein [Fervidicella metallireducens AeB]